MLLEKNSRSEALLFYLLVGLGALVTAVGLAAALYMEHAGHVVTGMNNQVVWGMPHVFAIFLIVAASGVLNVASIGSVFGKTVYKTRAPLSGLLALVMLAAGLMVIMLDLGRADRLIVAMTHFNPSSVFGWNVILYPGFFAIVGLYLWTLMDRKMNPYYKPAGLAAFVWRHDDDGKNFNSKWPYLIRIRYRLHDPDGRLASGTGTPESGRWFE
ncbi:MAG: polysulfide reductase NrfD, partial [Rhodocyclaceae bacterium]|nr:polysulfide reductase NrfD [Rhodocyclaceae bacterium]